MPGITKYLAYRVISQRLFGAVAFTPNSDDWKELEYTETVALKTLEAKEYVEDPDSPRIQRVCVKPGVVKKEVWRSQQQTG